MHAVNLIGFFGDRLPQPEIPLLRTVAVKTFMSGQIIHGQVHGFNSRHGKRLRHIADAAANQPFGRLRMGFGKRMYAAPYFREQISRLQLEEVIVNIRHGFSSKRFYSIPGTGRNQGPFPACRPSLRHETARLPLMLFPPCQSGCSCPSAFHAPHQTSCLP